MQASIDIPRPCHVGAEQLTPTAAGWHCARCQTTVVDFSRLSDAEILAHLAGAGARRVCAVVAPQQLATPAPRRRWARWLAVALAFLGLRTAAASAADAADPASEPKPLAVPAAELGKPLITIRGQIIDDSLNVPVSGAHIFVGDTPYGAVADAQGRFELPIPVDRPEVRGGKVRLRISAGAFTFQAQTIDVAVKPTADPAALTVRLKSIPGRGYVKGKARLVAPPKPFLAP